LPPFEAHHPGLGGLDYVAIAIWVILLVITLFMFYSLNRSVGEVNEGIKKIRKDMETLSEESSKVNALLKEV